ncbi:hypothetical protein J1N35_040679 [Gossypium stocksii]|uniref:Uncharacterized protein n=1 Tax=Gossypium stocksii TaxID=47602 RepID=A0A9D3ZII0_9ROSI|nr:hypothetical protein J1N35_040679 [Gossypium stocksii]
MRYNWGNEFSADCFGCSNRVLGHYLTASRWCRLATLMLRMGLRQVKQIEVGYIHVKAIQKVMTVNAQRAQTMNVELYSHYLESFRVQEYISHRSGLLPRSYAVDLRNKHYECRKFQSLQYS